MSSFVLITRPYAEAKNLAQILREKKLTPLICPMTHIIPIPIPIAGANLITIGQNETIQAFVATSANALKALGDLGHTPNLRLPFFAVGPATARAARQFGFIDVRVAQEDQGTQGDQGTQSKVRALASLITQKATPDKGTLLYLAGRERSENLAAMLINFKVRLIECYHAQAISNFPDYVASAFAKEKISAISFFSKRAAEICLQLAKPYNLRNIIAFCLSNSIALVLRGADFSDIKITSGGTQSMIDSIIRENI